MHVLHARRSMTLLFAAWLLAGCGGDTSSNDSLPSPTNYTLNVTMSASGTVTSSPAGINCSTSCSTNYGANTSVVLTATPGAGYIFSGWSGACTGTSTCSLTMSSARSAVATFVVTPPAFVTTYYVSDCQVGAAPGCVAGDDGNAGTNPAAPWRTTAKVKAMFASLLAGDQILFARGASFTDAGMTFLYNVRSTRTKPIVFADYTPAWASGSPGRPILTESRSGMNLFDFEDSGNADHDEGYVIHNLDLRGGGTGKWGVFLYNDVDHVTLDNLNISGFEIGVHSAGANTPNVGANQVNEHIQVLNSTITDNSGQGFLGDANDLLIEGNSFDNNGFALAVFNHNIYVSNSENATIRGNTLTRATFIAGQCQGTSLVVHGVMSGLVIENNTVTETAAAGTCYGIAVDTGYSTPENFRGSVIRNNRVVNVGNIGIGVASCPDCVIENNVIVQERVTSFIGIAVPDRVRGVDDVADGNITVRNNSIYMVRVNTSSIGIAVRTEGANHAVFSNLVAYGATSAANSSCFDTAGLTASAFRLFDYNLCYFAGAGGRWEATHSTLATWQALGLDMHSRNADPLFANPSGPTYSLAVSAGSSAINTGHPSESTAADILGALRDAQPDIGAYEF